MSTALDSLHFTANDALPGLVAVSGRQVPDRIEEQYALRQAADIGGIDYVFFRRFSDDRSSQAAACVVDNSDDHFSEVQLAEIHRKLWLNGFCPLLYVGWHTRVDILTCARGPDFWTELGLKYGPVETIEIAKEISLALDQRLNRFSAYRLSDGTFWDDPDNSDLAEAEKAAHQQLIRAVVETDSEIDGAKHPALRRLLLLTILIKYLEDRGVFPGGWFKQFHTGAKTFFDVLNGGSPDTIRELLSKLEKKFNGDVFELPEAHKKLTAKDLRRLADLVEAKTLGAQRYLWEQFSFRYIPVEVLSHLYQHFAQAGKGAVFTPPILASLMLDYAMPYKRLTGDEQVLDPTCGSGVFLVGAFRRLVHFWQSRNNWDQPDVATLKSILRDGIFGVELQHEAVHLTAFSLALAICDALQPNVIWRDLRFDKLVGSNLHIGDFSEWLTSCSWLAKTKGFSVVVGNPPFMSTLNEAAVTFRKLQKHSAVIPDNQMAYFMLEQSTALLKAGGTLCLIQPQGFLYNEKARSFQKEYLSANRVEAILDFTSIRKLYDGADPKTVAVLAIRNEPVDDHRILHLTFRRTFSVKERIAFELDHYDRHSMTRQSVVKHPWSWRANLLGGGRLRHFAMRMDALPKMRAVLKEKHWDYGEGFVLATSGNLTTAAWLTGKPYLPTNAFDDDGIDASKFGTVAPTEFRSAYSPDRYSAPLVLIKKVETLPCEFWERGFIAYRDQIVGIHSPPEEKEQLREFYDQFLASRDILRALCAVFGTRALSSKATSLLKRDLDVLPWPDSKRRDWRLSWWEKTLCQDVVQFMGDFVRLGQNSALLCEQVSLKCLGTFAAAFVKMLGSVYSNLQVGEGGLLDGLAFQMFHFGAQSQIEWSANLSESLKSLIYKNYGDTLRTVRMLRFYERNTIVMIKPDRLRYWIPSTAIRDADETLVDLQGQGY